MIFILTTIPMMILNKIINIYIVVYIFSYHKYYLNWGVVSEICPRYDFFISTIIVSKSSMNTPHWTHESDKCISIRANPHVGRRDYLSYLVEFLNKYSEDILCVNNINRLKDGSLCTIIRLNDVEKLQYHNHHPPSFNMSVPTNN